MLGHRNDVPELLRKSDVLVLPSIEEGSALVTAEARASGCVLLVSEGAGATCEHMKTGLVHRVGDAETLTQHITLLHKDRALLERLRAASVAAVPEITWTAAGERLLHVYRDTIAAHSPGVSRDNGRDNGRGDARPRREHAIPAEPRRDIAEPAVAVFAAPAAQPRHPPQPERRVVGFGDDLPAFLARPPRVAARA